MLDGFSGITEQYEEFISSIVEDFFGSLDDCLPLKLAFSNAIKLPKVESQGVVQGLFW